MAGIYFDENRVKISVQDWANKIIYSRDTWEGNNLHIDEIDSLKKTVKSEWINVSLFILNVLARQLKLIDSLILFLHIDLKYSAEKMSLDKLSLRWLEENLSEYTPPSLNFTSFEYYANFYEKELVECKPDISISKLIHSSMTLDFFYRTYFDEDEEMFSREIYVFVRGTKKPLKTQSYKV